jgi:hypothetical protein
VWEFESPLGYKEFGFNQTLFRYMASVYILFSRKMDRFLLVVVGLSQRLDEHLQGVYKNSFTSKATDWYWPAGGVTLSLPIARRRRQNIP